MLLLLRLIVTLLLSLLRFGSAKLMMHPVGEPRGGWRA